jgi:hypothetical protein
MANVYYGIPFTGCPKAIKMDIKADVCHEVIRGTGFSRLKSMGYEDYAEITIMLQKRWEDADGVVHALRVGTAIHRIEEDIPEWKNGHEFVIRYGDITSEPDYRDYMGMKTDPETAYHAQNSKGENVLGLGVCLFLELLLKLDHSLSKLIASFGFNALKQHVACLVNRNTGDLFKSFQMLAENLLDLLANELVFVNAFFKLLIFALELVRLLVERFFLLSDSSLHTGDLGTALLDLTVCIVSLAQNIFFCLEQSFFRLGFCGFDGIIYNVFGFFFCRADSGLSDFFAVSNPGKNPDRSCNDNTDNRTDENVGHNYLLVFLSYWKIQGI